MSRSSTNERIIRLLLKIEEDAFADAKPCPVCLFVWDEEASSATERRARERKARLRHLPTCELAAVLRDYGVR